MAFGMVLWRYPPSFLNSERGLQLLGSMSMSSSRVLEHSSVIEVL